MQTNSKYLTPTWLQMSNFNNLHTKYLRLKFTVIEKNKLKVSVLILVHLKNKTSVSNSPGQFWPEGHEMKKLVVVQWKNKYKALHITVSNKKIHISFSSKYLHEIMWFKFEINYK